MEALRRQMRQKVVGLFAWFEGDYAFERKKIKSDRVTVFEMPLPSLVLEGIRAYYDPETIRAIFDEIRHLRLRRKDYLPFDAAVLGLTDAESRLLELADGTRNVETILHETPLGAAESYQFLYAMMLLGVFEGLIEAEEIAQNEAEAGGFPDIDFLEEQAERAARNLEEATVSADRRGAGPVDDVPDATVPAAAEPVASAAVSVDLDDLDALDLALGMPLDPPAATAGFQVLEDPTSTAFADLTDEDRALRDTILRDYLALEGANHYQVMGIARDADVEEVKKRYLVLVKTFHADTLGRKFDPGVVQKANEVFARVTEAYKVLVNAPKRLQYDRRLTESGEEKKERKVANILIAENHFKRGQEHLKRRAFDLAAAEFAKAIELFPEESEYHTCLGWSIYNAPGRDAAEKVDEAITLIQKGIALNPKSDVAFLYLGRVLKDRGQSDAAMQAFAQAFKFNRMNAEARNELKALQIERVRARRAPDKSPDKGKASLRKILTTDVDLDTVKKSILKIFWS
jgi:curved DNA-binding protein CbpA